MLNSSYSFHMLHVMILLTLEIHNVHFVMMASTALIHKKMKKSQIIILIMKDIRSFPSKHVVKPLNSKRKWILQHYYHYFY